MQQVLKFWWVIALLAIAGGIFGYEISQVRTPVYESVGIFTVSLDFVRTGEMTDIEEDQALNTVVDVINSTAVLDETTRVMKAKGVDLTLTDLKNYVSVDRQGFQILVHVNHTNAQTAFDIADSWTAIADQALQTAIREAVKADSLSRQIVDLEICFRQMTVAFPAFPPCEIKDSTSLLTTLKQAENDFLDAKNNSRGILSTSSVELTGHPQVPVSPRIYRQGILVISGAFMGFLAGALLVECGFLGKWSRRDAKSQ